MVTHNPNCMVPTWSVGANREMESHVSEVRRIQYSLVVAHVHSSPYARVVAVARLTGQAATTYHRTLPVSRQRHRIAIRTDPSWADMARICHSTSRRKSKKSQRLCPRVFHRTVIFPGPYWIFFVSLGRVDLMLTVLSFPTRKTATYVPTSVYSSIPGLTTSILH